MQNLKNIYDHPAVLLRHYGNPAHADHLTKYEEEHGVTFVALDNETLARVQEAYDNYGKHGDAGRQEFRSAVADLLGLDD